MTAVIEVQNLTKHYKEKNALDNVSLTLEGGAIYGLLGRNGAGKTTLMSILTAQNFESSGTVRVFGEHPYENTHVLNRICFVRESQKYPDDAYPRHAFKAASLFFRNWSQELADELIEQFQLPMKQTIKKLSRGQLSAVGVIIGLASRAELTFFDEPYLGLDAVARQIFYDRLLEDYAEHPRTIVLSSHLIDEVSNLIEKVIVIATGRSCSMKTRMPCATAPSPWSATPPRSTPGHPAARFCTGRPSAESPPSPCSGRCLPPTAPRSRHPVSISLRCRCSS